MKKLFLPLLAIVALAACKKDNTNNNPTPAATDGFTWTEDGGAAITADSAFWTSWGTGTGVRAFKNGYDNFFEINWDGAGNTAVGTKALDAGKGITFLKGTATYTNAGPERINITVFSNDKLSGNFTVTMTGGTIQEVSGTFNNIPRR